VPDDAVVKESSRLETPVGTSYSMLITFPLQADTVQFVTRQLTDGGFIAKGSIGPTKCSGERCDLIHQEALEFVNGRDHLIVSFLQDRTAKNVYFRLDEFSK
jgi:hypothetical protein